MRFRLAIPLHLGLLLLAVALSSKAQQIAVNTGLESTANVAEHSQTPPASSTEGPLSADKKKDSHPVQSTHQFWDRKNDWLFAGVGAGRALDYASTMNLRRRGIDEVFLTNAIVDNHPLFAGIEVAATAASIGVSYLFHRTGHHTLERWTSAVHIGVAVGGAARNYALPTPH
jgi:hypothetical protein